MPRGKNKQGRRVPQERNAKKHRDVIRPLQDLDFEEKPRKQKRNSQTVNDGISPALRKKDAREVGRLSDPYYQRNVPAEADIVSHLAGGRGRDIRAANHTVPQPSTITEMSSTNQLSVVAQTDMGTLYAAAVGLATQLVKRGASTLLQAASSSVNPWIAAQAWQQMLTNVQAGQYPDAINLPGWMWNILQTLVPKNVNWKTGKLNASWLSGAAPIYGNGIVTMTQNGYSYSTVFGYQSIGQIVNMYSTLLPHAGLTDQGQGVLALQKLLAVFPQDLAMQKLVLQPDPLPFIADDVSSMAMCYAEIGSSGLCDTGGLAVTAYSEKKINIPLVAHFAPYQGDVNNYRGTWEYRKTGASPTYLMGRAWELGRKTEWTNKLSPFIKFYNFDEYWIQLNLILAGALTQGENFDTPGPYPSCPLTAQQVQILLRQEMLGTFSNDLAFDLRCDDEPFLPIIPFQVGNNGVPTSNAGMRLPRFFVECVRTVKRHISELANGTLVDYVPVLGRPNPQFVAQLGGFSYTVGDMSVPIFATVGGEVPVDIIDLHAIVESTPTWLVIGGTEYANEITLWNSWIEGLQANLTGLCTIGEEGGIAALYSNIWSCQQLYVAPTQPSAVTNQTKVLAKQSSKKHIQQYGIVMPKVSATAPVPDANSSIYQNNIFIVRDSCVNPIYSATWKYQSAIVKPAWLYTISNNEASDSMLRSLYCEPWVLQSGGTMPAGNQIGAYPTIYSRIAKAAEFDVKTTFQGGQLNEMEVDFNELAAKGRGGFFTGLASMFGRAIGVPAISEAADAIGRVVDV